MPAERFTKSCQHTQEEAAVGDVYAAAKRKGAPRVAPSVRPTHRSSEGRSADGSIWSRHLPDALRVSARSASTRGGRPVRAPAVATTRCSASSSTTRRRTHRQPTTPPTCGRTPAIDRSGAGWCAATARSSSARPGPPTARARVGRTPPVRARSRWMQATRTRSTSRPEQRNRSDVADGAAGCLRRPRRRVVRVLRLRSRRDVLAHRGGLLQGRSIQLDSRATPADRSRGTWTSSAAT